MVKRSNTGIFALIIGIDRYQAKQIQSLRGAVADARAVRSYLVDSLNTPEDHIVVLENQSASRAAILEELRRLANNSDIRPGDPILIYFAGHGSQATAPHGWDAGGLYGYIQLILPYDSYCGPKGQETQPIADRTLGACLDNIAAGKGNNIFVILDSCHSASGTRSEEGGSSYELVRSTRHPQHFPLEEGPLNAEDLFSRTSSESHVLLSACGSSGQAWERDGRGVFTTALLDLLSNTPLKELRYCDIAMRLDTGNRQFPHCEGLNQDKVIFTLTSVPPFSEPFAIHRTRIQNGSPIKFVINAGSAHGFGRGDEFEIYADDQEVEPEGTLIVKDVWSYFSVLEPTITYPSNLSGHSIAKPVKPKQLPPVRVYCTEDVMVARLVPLVECPSVAIVATPDDAQVDIAPNGDSHVSISLHNFPAHGINPVIASHVEVKDLSRVLATLQPHLCELAQTSQHDDLTPHVHADLHRLQMSAQCFPDAPSAELNSHYIVPSQSGLYHVEHDSPYGIRIRNESMYKLFPLIQLFTMGPYFHIHTLYRSPCGPAGLDAPLPPGRALTLGYGAGGSAPLVIPLSACGVISIIKVSLYTRPLDPRYDQDSFRNWKVKAMSDALNEPWATILLPIASSPAPPRTGSDPLRGPVSEYQIGPSVQAISKPYESRVLVPYYEQNKGVYLEPAAPISKQLGWLGICKTRWSIACARFESLSRNLWL
ncbi:hypothetical protein CVT26_013038 [Gymnopilus dilepis]|uniref:Peptidase C14 caspase domain-containing protein n=1 Tax=Gymnopilus dilepis TaxID=231916 RepID=A0A409Y4D9_9AGAR|nr:hypothetical protein CVT26_013038 [Gymnopilus dilepis]